MDCRIVMELGNGEGTLALVKRGAADGEDDEDSIIQLAEEWCAQARAADDRYKVRI